MGGWEMQITADVGRDYCPTNILGLCALVLLDGASPDLTAHLEVVRGAEALAREQGQVVHFMWADASCHPEFASHFGLAPDLLPAVVALAPKKGKHAVMRGGFEAASVNGFLAAVLRGRETLVDDDMNALPMAASGVDCAAVHAASLESLEEEEDFDLSDIMAEEVGDESERAALRDEAEAAAAAATLDSEEAEMAAKRRKAMEELERLNKKSQKKKKGKKGKKGKKKRKAAAKDEL
ncbi:uncharacterized protein MONBRDRAFT_36880 [Monosiga brevicollis MX1]|uniref:Thioredoxin domain-containing protein n=1 Tax=Monosiga brevicollis TaxID=81824 RepID=A9UXH3_MONBE|nr:uncharacterized protein MONBRDRAFT_36880 [Monosiga brevicollis MX1]EDQ90007.1 predicted protein [Monosiga brevicollis MX1]|eukprot:XP_001745429.1 hypothetical protein [Monosiga brevicollis MX1]